MQYKNIKTNLDQQTKSVRDNFLLSIKLQITHSIIYRLFHITLYISSRIQYQAESRSPMANIGQELIQDVMLKRVWDIILSTCLKYREKNQVIFINEGDLFSSYIKYCSGRVTIVSSITIVNLCTNIIL